MSKRLIAVIIGAALVAGSALTASAWAANGFEVAKAGSVVAGGTTTRTVGPDDASASLFPVGPRAPWITPDPASSDTATGAPFGWIVRVMSHDAFGHHGLSSSDTTDAPFGWAVSAMAHLRNSARASVPLAVQVGQAHHAAPPATPRAASRAAIRSADVGAQPTMQHASAAAVEPAAHAGETMPSSRGMMGPHH